MRLLHKRVAALETHPDATPICVLLARTGEEREDTIARHLEAAEPCNGGEHFIIRFIGVKPSDSGRVPKSAIPQ